MKKTIVLDAGHGGKDRYNLGYSSKYIEADGNLEFVLYLRDELQDFFNVILTRDVDKTLSLTERGLMAKGTDMFLSIHSDAFSSPSAGGVTIFDSVDLENEEIAKKIGQACADAMEIKFRGTKEREYENTGEDYYTVIDKAQDVGCPCVLLLERGFHSNPKEEQLLLDSNIVKKSAIAVANEIKKYFGVDIMPEIKQIKLNILGNETTIEGILIEDKNYISVRELLEKMGYIVEWDNENKNIIVKFKLKEE